MARLLTICPYSLLPLRGGGALRSFHLLRQLAREHEVHAIIFQREAELRRETEGYQVPDSVRVYSPNDDPPPRTWFDKLPRLAGPGLHYRWLRRSSVGPAEGALLRCYHLVCQILLENRIEVVVFEHRSTMKAAPLARRLSPSTRLVLDAHNVDHRLMAQEYSGGGTRTPNARERKWIARTEWEEDHLQQFVDAVWCCSEEDRRALAAPGRVPGYVIPNGVDCSSLGFDVNPAKAQSPFLLFSGWMGTEANKDAVAWLIRDLWPLLTKGRPGLRLLLVGGGMPAALAEEARAKPGVEVSGEVADVRPWFRKASVALVPLRIGSGTRLKILEAMSQGNPVVSTRRGAEGIEVRNGETILLADDPAAFAQAVIGLLDDHALFDRVRATARKFVENHYDWDVVGKAANQSIRELVGGKVESRK